LAYKTLTSGFETNYTTGDTMGWHPHPVLNGKLYLGIMLNVLGNRSTTEYRRFYNEPTPFHRNTKLYKLRNLQLKPTPEEKYSS